MTAEPTPTLRTDRRGVSGLLALLFAFAIAASLVVLLQVSAVPVWNLTEEYEHSQQVDADMADLGGAIDGAVDTGVSSRTSVVAGVGYPDRPLFFNPPPAAGDLRTTERATARLSNVEAVGSSGRYWTGGVHAFETQAVTFVPTYHELTDEATTVHEGNTLFVRHGNGAERVVHHALVDGNRVTLVFLEGDVATHGAELATLEVVPVSAGGDAFEVRNDVETPVRLELPTSLSRESWEEELAGTHATVVGYTPPVGDSPGLVTVELATASAGGPATYEFSLTKVGVGDGWVDPTPAYVVATAGDGATVPVGGTQRAVVEVRDEYDNPVVGELVRLDADGTRGTVEFVGGGNEAVTDGQGRVVVRYSSPTTPGTDEFTVDAPGIGGDLGMVTYTVSVAGADDARDDTPEFDIVDGTVVPNETYTGSVEVIAVAIQHGGDGVRVPVHVEVGVGDTLADPWPENVNTGERYRYDLGTHPSGTPITVVASTSYVGTVESTDVNDEPQLVYVLRDGDQVPDVAGYNGQKSVGGYLVEAGFVDAATNTVVLDDDQAIYLFELGATDEDSRAFDLQDAVVVVTLESA